ncbi:ribosomal protein S6-containing protein [Patellaria atrata CBS 101060]|uniref:Small ribosomal subunit protein bS6m n=1 Tax=Patellaria atrata CBS 101060 TaxID=1346257 RepID=A0A9P4S394_9PEZI|nr:ribosomal protein S6-containing protein [Patellaria atrata CBS 101060]
MLYELIGIVRPGKLHEIKEIAKTAGSTVLNSGGVIRGITNWGTFLLPKPTRKHQVLHHTGHYFIMRFDSSARTQHAVRRTLSLDPRMIRYSIVNMGSKLQDIKDIGGKAEFSGREEEMDQ